MFFETFMPAEKSYPTPARGWNGGVYTERKAAVKETTWDAYISDGTLCIQSKMWTETESTGFGIYPYVNSLVILNNSGLKDGRYNIVFTNPTNEAYKVSAFANNILKLDGIEVPAHSDVRASFELCSIEETTELQFFVPSDATTEEEAIINRLYIKDLTYEELKEKAPKAKPAIFIASDSTVQSYEEFYYPQTGWGQVFHNFFKTKKANSDSQSPDMMYPQCHDYELDNITIVNRSIGARSARSFINEGKWDALLSLAAPGDFCIIQWAHNDATAVRPNRYVAPCDFAGYLSKYIDSCRARKISLIMVTPVARRNCDDHEGRFVMSFEEYRNVMLKVGEKEHIPVVDLCKMSCDYLNEIGPEESKLLYLWAAPGAYPDGAYADGVSDNTHLQEYGAKIYAKMVAQSIKEFKDYPELTAIQSYIDIGKEIPKPVITKSSAPVDPEIPSGFALQELHVENKQANFLLIWNDVPGAVRYNVYRKGSVDFQFFPLRTVTKEEKASAAVLPFSLPATDVYRVNVTAVFENGQESKPSRTIEFRT